MDRDGMLSPDAVGIPAHRFLHPEGSVTGADGMVLMRQRRPEERHDPVAHDLVHRTLVTVDGLHHVLENGIEKLAGFFRVTVGKHFHRPLQIGEEDRHLLAFTFEGGLQGENLFGEVPGGVGLWRAKLAGRDCCGAGHRRTTAAAELFAAFICESAGRTDESQRQPALSAEAAAIPVLSMATRTLHGGASPRAWTRTVSQVPRA